MTDPNTALAPGDDNLDVEYIGCQSSDAFQNLQFEACVFRDCQFENAQFQEVSFVDCRFVDSDLSMVDFTQSVFNGAVFEKCRLRGVDWTRVSAGLLSLEFEECVLDYGAFDGMKLKKTSFRKCSGREATFDGADLRESDFGEANLDRASFVNSDLRKADFRGAENLSLDLRQCRCEGLKLRLVDAKTILQTHGIKVSS